VIDCHMAKLEPLPNFPLYSRFKDILKLFKEWNVLQYGRDLYTCCLVQRVPGETARQGSIVSIEAA